MGVVSVSSDYTAKIADRVILCDGTLTVTMYSATNHADHETTIKNVGSGAITVVPTGSETIDGDTSKVISTADTSITLVNDTNNWFIR